MRIVRALLSEQWGSMAHVRGVVSHSLSPHEQRVFAGFAKHKIPNTFRRFTESTFVIGPWVLVGLLLYDFINKTHEKYMRKDPSLAGMHEGVTGRSDVQPVGSESNANKGTTAQAQ